MKADSDKRFEATFKINVSIDDFIKKCDNVNDLKYKLREKITEFLYSEFGEYEMSKIKIIDYENQGWLSDDEETLNKYMKEKCVKE